MREIRPALAAATLALLSACGEPEEAAQTGSGEVVQGTISDDMLPLDRLMSQPPLADPIAAERATSSPTADNASADTNDEVEEDANAEGAETASEPDGAITTEEAE